MKTKLFKKLLPILLSILIIGTSIPLQVFASTSFATEINSQTLFEASTLDTLELNIISLPTVTINGTEKYKINISDTTPVTLSSIDTMENINVVFDCGFDKKLDATVNVMFSNCGTLNSKPIDMKLTYSDIYSAPKTNTERFDTKCFWWTAYGTLSQQTNKNEWFEVGFSRYNIDISFYYHNTDVPIWLDNSYLTLYSEDGNKDSNANITHTEASSTMGRASNVYIYENTNMAYYSSWNCFGKQYKDVYYGTGSGSTVAKDKNAVCWQYQNSNSINLDMMVGYGQWSMGYHLNFIPLTACVPDEPVKTVSKETATGNTNIEYSIKQTLPTAYDKNFKLKSLKLADILEKPIDYVSANVYDEKGTDITQIAGTLSYDKNTKEVMYEFNADYLKGINYNGQIVTMKIIVVTKENIDVREINNKSISNFNDTDVLYSNTVQTNIYYPVTVNYLDEQGNKLAESSTNDYFVGDNYSTKAKTISNYVLTEIPSNADGAVINSAITVDYIYRLKNTNIIVNYIDTEGNPLAESDTINGKVFDEYTTEAKDIYGYELTAVPNNATGEMTEDEIVVNYIYSLKSASVIVNYKTETGDKLTESITIDGKVFDNYTTENKTFNGYELIATPDNANGTMTEDIIVIDYIYRLKGATVTVNYIDTEGNPLAESDTINGKVFDEYTTKAKDIQYYSLTAVPDNATGEMTDKGIIVNYIYSQNESTVTINYLEKDTDTKLATTVIYKYLQGSEYDVNNETDKSIQYYKIVSVKGDEVKGIVDSDKIINVYYEKRKSNIVINFIDWVTKEVISPLINKTQEQGTDYDVTTDATKEIEYYTYYNSEGNVSGVLEQDENINSYYVRNENNITIKYVEKGTDKELANTVTQRVHQGTDYNVSDLANKEIDCYNLDSIEGLTKGFITEDIEIIVYYTTKATDVVVKYVDTEGKALTKKTVIDGKVFDNYTTENKTFYGYELTEMPDNANGTMTENTITVIYVYRLKDTSVVVNYKTETGDKLADSITFDGKVFDKYNTEQMEFHGYELIAVPDNATGEMTEDEIVVDYIYSLKPASVIVNYKTETGDKLADSITLDGKVFDKYNTEQMEFYGYELIAVPDNATGEMAEDVITVDYIYRLKDAKVIVKYVDTENKELEKSIIIEGKVFDEYVTEQKDIKDYSFVKATPNIAGTMTEDTIEVIYTYTRTILNEIKVIETEKPVEQTNKDTPVEIEIVDTGDTNNTVKLAVMSGLLVVFIIIFVLVSKKMKKK